MSLQTNINTCSPASKLGISLQNKLISKCRKNANFAGSHLVNKIMLPNTLSQTDGFRRTQSQTRGFRRTLSRAGSFRRTLSQTGGF